MDKRTFLKSSALLGVGSLFSFSAVGRMFDAAKGVPPGELAEDEDFWKTIRDSYLLKPEYINLESGYYNIIPQETLEGYFGHLREVNQLGAYYMRNMQAENKKRVAGMVAELAGCGEDEVIITRNTTESLDMIISGLDWQPGDEAVMAEQDYGAMLNMFKQVSKRYGMVNKVVSVLQDPETDEEIVQLYANAITKNTKLLMICHMINITGHVLPVRKICDMAHSKGVQVMVDGAHTFAHLDFKIPDLDCDYYGCSLHKWLAVPLGSGMLYVKKGNASKIWPLLAEEEKPEDDILRLNHTGTHPVATDLAIADAIEFHNRIGGERKEARLRYLQQYWTSKVRGVKNVQLFTPADPARSCAIANAGIKGMKPKDMAKTLFDKYKVYTVAIDNAGVHGCRITPNVFTTKDELDVLVKAIKEMAA